MNAIPNLHAALIHFPVGLLGAAILSDLAGWAWPRLGPSRAVVALLYLAGTLSLLAAYLAGREAAATVFTPGMAHPVVLAHWNLALAVTVYFAAYSVLQLSGLLVAPRIVARWRHLLTAAGLVGGLGLLLVADRGGELVYRLGVGVAAR